MRTSLVVSAFAFVSLAAIVTPAHAITGNWVEDNEHPYVGLIVFYNAAGEYDGRCSGSLISATKFLTAGHCIDTGGRPARVYFQQDAGAHYDPALGYDPVTLYPKDCAPGTLGTLCATATSDHTYNYGFADFAGFPDIRDVGLVILDQPIALPK